MKVTTITLPLLCLTGCQSLVIDQIVIKSPNWLPGVDIYLEVEDDVYADFSHLTDSPNVQNPSLCYRGCCQVLRKPSDQPEPKRHQPLRNKGARNPRTDQ